MQLTTSLFVAVALLVTLVHDVRCYSRKPVLRKPAGSAKTGCYIIAIKEKATEADVQELLTRVVRASDEHKMYGMVQKATRAFTVKLSPYSLEMVRGMAAVEYIEEEGFAVGDNVPPSDNVLQWHLDRIDQAGYPLDLTYSPISEGEGADIYILDSGISYDHEEFEYRAKYAGRDPVDEYSIANEVQDNYQRRYGRDCHGHGTHVASLSGGKTFGSAKKATIYSVRVLACNNAAPWTVILDGLDYVLRTAPSRNRPSIISMSLSGDFYRVVNDAVSNIIKQGIHVVTAAGNGQVDACSRSPASVEPAISVGGTRNGDGLYLLGSGTNFGPCVDIFSPGERVLAADWTCANCSKMLSGTSMSTPIVSGVAAIQLSRQPLLTPDQLKKKLIEDSLKDVLIFDGIPNEYRSTTPNRLLHLPGSCGGNGFFHSHSAISSPNFPSPYPHNLHCVWHIAAEEGQQVQLNLTLVQLEAKYDVLRVFEGCCCEGDNQVAEFTGNYGNIDYTYISQGEGICLQLLTDQTVNAQGFNGSFTKLYTGTNIRVPEPDVVLPTAPPVGPQAVPNVITLRSLSPKRARSEVASLVDKGYKVTWITTHRGGPTQRHGFDIILTNHTSVDTRVFIDLGYVQLNETIYSMLDEGYSVQTISDRERGNAPTSSLSYTVLFTRTIDILETEVFLRDSVDEYHERLSRMNASGYRIASHSVVQFNGKYEVSSVYKRDRRIAFNISIDPPPKLVSFFNVTFFDFTRLSLDIVQQSYYLNFVEVYADIGNPSARFSAILYEHTDRTIHRGNWFRWGLDEDSLKTLIAGEGANWDPFLICGYNYIGVLRYFIEFVRHVK